MSDDELYEEAKRMVIESQRASVSMVQRRLRIRYGEAEKMMERMEQDGIVSPLPERGVRSVLVRKLP